MVYVWFDALVNYLTAIGYPDDQEKLNNFWPADIHLIGKDILRFHTVYWPTFLMSAGLPLPERVFAHGWSTVDGEKMSKSLGNVIDPNQVIDEYGVDAFRYFLLREVPFGMDGDFSHKAMVHRINSDLANDLGNLFSRSLAMAIKYSAGEIFQPASFLKVDEELMAVTFCLVKEVDVLMDELSFNQVLSSIWKLVGAVNKYINERRPGHCRRMEKERDYVQSYTTYLSRCESSPYSSHPFCQPHLIK